MPELTDKNLKQLVGYTIVEATSRLAWDQRDVESVTLKLSKNGKTHRVHISAQSQKGCEECDGDGSGIDSLDMWLD